MKVGCVVVAVINNAIIVFKQWHCLYSSS